MTTWKTFKIRELHEAWAFADSGGIAVHQMGDLTGDLFANAPRVFHKRRFAHLFGPNREILTAAAIEIGCKASWIQRPDDPRRVHFDLVGAILQRALKRCNP